MRKILLSSVIVASVFAANAVNVTGIRDASLNKDSQNLAKIEYISTLPVPGQVKTIKKSYVTAPPMIPHKVANMLPIKIHHNECLSCHKPSPAKALGINSMPRDHFVDNFEGDKKTGLRVAGSRFNCTQCHAPQAKLDPVIENRFESIQNAKLNK